MSTPRHEKARPVDVAKQNTERADPTHNNEKDNTMFTPKSTLTATAPQGFALDPDPHDDGGRITLCQDRTNNVIGVLSIGSYSGLHKGRCYSLDPVGRNRDCTLAELKVADAKLARLIRRTAQIEGGAR